MRKTFQEVYESIVSEASGLPVFEAKIDREQIIKRLSEIDGQRVNRGLMTVDYSSRKKKLTVEYYGNMGSTITRCIDPKLTELGLQTIDALKKLFPVIKEDGSPDYEYVITFRIE